MASNVSGVVYDLLSLGFGPMTESTLLPSLGHKAEGGARPEDPLWLLREQSSHEVLLWECPLRAHSTKLGVKT